MPSASLFKDYCNHLIKAYKLEDVVKKGYATSVVRESPNLYTVQLGDGGSIQARRVVCALGPNLRKEKMFWEAGIGVRRLISTPVHPHMNEVVGSVGVDGFS